MTYSRNPFTAVYEILLRLSPPVRAFSGIVCIGGGAYFTLRFLDIGLIWGPSLFFVAAGFFLLIGGIVDQLRTARRQVLWNSVMSREAELIAGMTDAANQGKAPARYLNDQGIIDPDLRAHFISQLKTVPGAAEAPKPAAVRPGWRPPAPKRNV